MRSLARPSPLMHPDLEALIRFYDAASEAPPETAAERRDEFEQRFQEVLSRTPGINEEIFRAAIRSAHRRWLAASRRPPTLPPKA